MPVRMISPTGAVMHAYTESEVIRLQGLGWVLETPKVETVPVKRKPGRPAKAK